MAHPETTTPLIDSMSRALNVMSRRQQLIASNVANVGTPGYQAVDVDFDRELRKALAETAGPRDGGAVVPARVRGLTARPDGNNVHLEREMAALAQTRGRYRVAALLIRMRFRQLTSALVGGDRR